MIVITHKSNGIENNPDREFMEEYARIDKYHLATACLNAWRHM